MRTSSTKNGISFLCLMMSSVGVWLLYVLLSGCSAPAERPPLDPGQALYSAKCASCHRLLPAQDYTADVWQEYVVKYGKQATEQQRQEILRYLQQNARPAQ
ncbi:MAG: c-type cytochrome [Planctomycetota bacterium]|jgi:mono/diheme cytochrome c family protein|nr:cytochrome c [Phycisphaerae bacterium]